MYIIFYVILLISDAASSEVDIPAWLWAILTSLVILMLFILATA